MHRCHQHYDGNDGKPISRRRRSAEEDYDVEKLFDVSIAGEKGEDLAANSIFVTPAVMVEEDSQKQEGPADFLANICGKVSADKDVSIIVVVGMAVFAVVELTAVLFCANALRRGCWHCVRKCGGGSNSSNQNLCV